MITKIAFRTFEYDVETCVGQSFCAQKTKWQLMEKQFSWDDLTVKFTAEGGWCGSAGKGSQWWSQFNPRTGAGKSSWLPCPTTLKGCLSPLKDNLAMTLWLFTIVVLKLVSGLPISKYSMVPWKNIRIYASTKGKITCDFPLLLRNVKLALVALGEHWQSVNKSASATYFYPRIISGSASPN